MINFSNFSPFDLKCSECKLLVHRECDGLNESTRSSFIFTKQNFICPKCSYFKENRNLTNNFLQEDMLINTHQHDNNPLPSAFPNNFTLPKNNTNFFSLNTINFQKPPILPQQSQNQQVLPNQHSQEQGHSSSSTLLSNNFDNHLYNPLSSFPTTDQGFEDAIACLAGDDDFINSLNMDAN